ncbi:MAG: MFS transporter [Fimbriimonadales bacterium]|nr:MFS transporter [Fimbriimonadales bacterium]
MVYREVLAIPAFRRLWLGQAISQFGDAFYYLIFVFMVNQITGNPAMVGYVGALQAIPFLLLGPYAGVLADRLDRRLVMLGSDLASAALLLGLGVWLAFDPEPPVEVLMPTAFLLSVVATFFMPAKSAAIPALVPPSLLLQANSLSAATQNVMPLIGVGLSGGVLAAVYRLFPRAFFLTAVVVNALSFLASAWYIARLPKILPDRSKPAGGAWSEFAEGLRLVRSDRVLALVLAIGFLVNLAVAPFFVVYVTVNTEWFGVPTSPESGWTLTGLKAALTALPASAALAGPLARTLAPGQYWVLAAFEGGFMLGMVLGSVLVGRLRIRRPGIAQVAGTAGCALTIVAMAFSPTFWGFWMWNFLAGIVLPLAWLPMNTYIQLILPDAFRGRVNSVFAMASFAAMPLGMSAAGVLVARFGAEAMFLMMGAAMILFVVPMLADRQFRGATMPEPAPATSGTMSATP